jgi:predicted Zn-dependent protease with MMP-like domain
MSRAQWSIAVDDSPSLDEFTELAEAALGEIPAEFRLHIEGVGLRIEDWPDQDTLRRMRIGHPLGLLGLYSGLPIGYKQAGAVVQHVDMIFLYREPILAHWRARGGRLKGPLKDLVKHVLVHEIGHHFGLSDADMERIESDAE